LTIPFILAKVSNAASEPLAATENGKRAACDDGKRLTIRLISAKVSNAASEPLAARTASEPFVATENG
jgi:hypothetical protein